MKRTAPGSISTIGTLNIIFGSLFSFCCVGGLLINVAGSNLFGDMDDDVIHQMLDRELPSYQIVTWLMQGFGILFFIIMLISGIGLVSKGNWGRILAIVNASALIPYCLGISIYTLAFEGPTVTRVLQDNPFPGAQEMRGMLWMGFIIRLGILLLVLVYAVITISVLLGASVRAYFSQTGYEMDRFYGDDDWDDRERGRGWRDWRD